MNNLDLFDLPKYCLICNVAGMLTCRQQNNVMAKLCRLSDYIELVSLETSLECVKAAYTTSIESYADRKALLLTRIIPIVIKFIDEEYELSAKQG